MALGLKPRQSLVLSFRAVVDVVVVVVAAGVVVLVGGNSVAARVVVRNAGVLFEGCFSG